MMEMNDVGKKGKKGKGNRNSSRLIRFNSVQFSSVQFNSIQFNLQTFTSLPFSLHTVIPSSTNTTLPTLATLASISIPLVPVVVPSTTPVTSPAVFRNNKPNPKNRSCKNKIATPMYATRPRRVRRLGLITVRTFFFGSWQRAIQAELEDWVSFSLFNW